MVPISELTIRPGCLAVASASPDPPFELQNEGITSGFDIELIRGVCRQLALTYVPLGFTGSDFNGIFDGLEDRTYDAVISGTTIAPERAAIARFSRPYLQFDRAVAINARLTPEVSAVR